jgi:ribose 5-phosphate isomerase A
VEVTPFAYVPLLQKLKANGAPQAVLRMAKFKAGPVVTDNGNFVIDAPFSPELLSDPVAVRTII